jgi:hypothetical protein
MLTSDRDLLAIDPALLRSIAWLGQRLSTGVCSVNSTTLTASTSDTDFVAANIQPGHILTIDDVSYEVIARISSTTLTVSRIRSQSTGASLPLGTLTDRPYAIYTFAPQRSAAESEVLSSLGLTPSSSSPPAGTLTETHITNPLHLVRPIALLTLRHLADAASLTLPSTASVARAATIYMLLFERAARFISAHIDTNNDGLPDLTRSPSRFHLSRG